MYKATIKATMGWGIDYINKTANTYKELMEKVDKFISANNNREVNLLGQTTVISILEVIYNYPSGKTFKKCLII